MPSPLTPLLRALVSALATASGALACTIVTISEPEGADVPADTDADPATCDTLESRANEVLTTYCGACHGAGGPRLGGISDILDVDALVAAGKLVRGDPQASQIYTRMVDEVAPMPPAGEALRPSADEVEAVKSWIAACGAPEDCSGQPFIARDEVLLRIREDLVGVDAPRSTRYFSLVNLRNAGLCDAEIEPYRQGLAKLVNSLSRGIEVVAPVPIDPERLLFRIDLRDYRWQAEDFAGLQLSEPTFYFDEPDEVLTRHADRWEMLAAQNPYAVEYLGSVAERIKDDTGTPFFVLRADAFIDASSRSPLYYDILDIPRCSARFDLESAACDPSATPTDCAPGEPCCEQCLDARLGVNVVRNILSELLTEGDGGDIVARAGLYTSGVSQHNRVIERHSLPFTSEGAFWISYDFASSEGQANIRVHPFDFKFAGGEVIYTLPNGLQGYMLSDEQGSRLNEAPTEIVQDPSQVDVVVRNGISCIGCHQSGMLPGRDDILRDRCEGPGADEEVCEDIKKLYPGEDSINALLDRDGERFRAALGRAQVRVDTEEPVLASFRAFGEAVTVRRAAAELELPEEVLLAELAALPPDLQGLRDAPLRREVFTASFAVSACLRRIGLTRCCPDSVDQLAPECVP